MSRWIFYFFTAVIAAFFVACQHDPLLDDMNPGGGGGGTNPPDTTGQGGKPCDPDSFYFITQVYPILQSNCAFSGCHGGGSAQDGVDLTSYERILSTAEVRPFDLRGSELYEVITETDPDKRMPPPPSQPLTSEQIAIIAGWINQGALNNSCDACDTSNVSFSKVIAPLIANSCQGCHSGSAPNGGIRLSGYDDIRVQALNGNLLGVVRHDNGFVAMPYNQPKLSDCRIEQIRLWIEDGAPNN